jgi:excinuclease ABC subunit C
VCEGRVPVAEYQAAVESAVACLSRPPGDLLEQMRADMMACAGRLEFERAQYLKERIEALECAIEPQVVERDVGDDEDVVYFGDEAVVVAHIERGALYGVDTFPLPGANGSGAREHLLVEQYGAGASPRLKRVIVNALDDPAALDTALAATGHAIAISLPSHNDHQRLLDLCALNYAYRARQ